MRAFKTEFETYREYKIEVITFTKDTGEFMDLRFYIDFPNYSTDAETLAKAEKAIDDYWERKNS